VSRQNYSGLQLQGVLVPGQTKRRYWNTLGASRRSWVQVADSLWVSQVIDIDYVLKVLNEANSWGFHGFWRSKSTSSYQTAFAQQ
jgi:hypothetical protein